eukprot:Seg2286.2 transcript_id=Seg2286.2/GoldUCD/mRNA.D3Y31 product="WD repeat SAM and U-box domain-containing protein 1" protein_id=Seg2286.2/GoldUCD/D3Y31
MKKSFYEEQKRSLGLPLLKRLEKAKLQDLQDSINAQEHAYRFSPQKNKKGLQGISWEWLADDGTWQTFEPEEQTRLEQACETGQKTVPFMDSIHFMHTVDLVQKERVNMRTGVGKPIRRNPPMPFNARSVKKSKGTTFKPSTGWNHSCEEDDDDVNIDEICSRLLSNQRTFSTFDDDPIGFLGASSLSVSPRTPGATTWSRHSPRLNDLQTLRSRASLGRDSLLEGMRLNRTSEKPPKGKTRLKANQPSFRERTALKISQKNNEAKKLQNWLKSFNFEEYYDKLKKEKITLKELPSLSEEDLKKLGLPMGVRKRMLEKIKEIGKAKEPPNEYLCPITMVLMKDPVILCDGFSYERTAIDKWLQEHSKSPMTNEALESKTLTPNRQLKKLIEDFKACEISG